MKQKLLKVFHVNFWTNSASYLLTCSRHPGRPQVPSNVALALERHPCPIHLAGVRYFGRLDIQKYVEKFNLRSEKFNLRSEKFNLRSRFFVRIHSGFGQISSSLSRNSHPGFGQISSSLSRNSHPGFGQISSWRHVRGWVFEVQESSLGFVQDALDLNCLWKIQSVSF